jgi:putative spermidine/putrescine transport system permease protein
MYPALRVRTLLRAAAIAVLCLWLVLPFFPLAIWSVARGWFFPDVLPQQWTLQTWELVAAGRYDVLRSVGLTLLIAALTTALALLVGLPAGRALGQHEFRGKGMIMLLLLAPIVVPGIAVVLGLHAVFIGLGLTNTVSGVVLAHLIPTLPYVIFVMAGIFANYDTALEDQARSLGANPRQVFVNVTLPIILPGVLVGALFAFLISWGQYILTLVIGGGKIITLPLLLFSFVSAGRHDMTGAIAMIYVVPGIIILAATTRYLSGRNHNITYFVHP